MALKPEQKNDRTWHFFSETLPDDIREQVLTISDNGVSKFATDILSFEGTETQIKARKNKQTGLWTVDRFTTVQADLDNPLLSQNPVMRNVCFFDALYYTAKFEKTEKSFGAVSAGAPSGDIPHFSAAAEQAGQPLDTGNIPHPALGGDILIGGNFTKKNYDVAAKTEAIPAVTQVKNLNPMALVIKEAQPLVDAVNENTVLDTKILRQDKVAQLEKIDRLTKKTTKQLKACFDERSLGEMYDDISFLATSILGGGFGLFLGAAAIADPSMLPAAVPAVSAAVPIVHYGWLEKGAELKLRYNFNRLSRETKKLPDGPQKTLLEDFQKSVAFTYYAEKAARHIEKCVDQGKKGRALRKSFNNIERAARRLSLSDAETQRLKAGFLDQQYEPGDFLKKLKEQKSEVRSCLAGQIRQLKA